MPMVFFLAACGSAAPEPDPPPPPEGFPGERGAPPTARMDTAREMWADLRAPRHVSDGGGRLRAVGAPEQLEAGSPIELALVYEVGEHGVAEGGGLYLLPSPYWGWSPPQHLDPQGAGYTTVRAPEAVDFELQAVAGMLVATVRGRALAPGDEVQFVYGAGGTARVDRFVERGPAVWMGVDGDGDRVRSVVPEPVELSIVAGPPAGLVATLPSTAEPGAEVALAVAVLDAHANAFRPVEGELLVEGPASVDAPARVPLRAADQGLASILVRPTAPGVVVLKVTGPGGLEAWTNPMVVRDGAQRILWGDLQIHSGLSDGTGAPADVWRYAREVAALDVAAITDHDHWGLRFLDATPGWRDRLDAAVDAAHEPGRFVAVHGYEWTSWLYGHRHVLYFDGPGPVHSTLGEATDTPEELREAVRGRRAVIVPHHVAGGPVALDWSRGLDPELEPVVEIASVHGQSEDLSVPGAIYGAVPGTFAFDQLARGLRFGLIGSTDGHDGHPGLGHLVGGGQGGLVALEADESTRDAVFAALRARRVYATNGRRIVLRVDVGGHPMGSIAPAAPTEVAVRVVGTDRVDHVELVGRTGVIGSRRGDGSAVQHATWTLEPAPGDLVYVRVVQVDGGLAWSSPVFFE